MTFPLTLTPQQARQVRAGAAEIALSERQALSIRAAVTSAAGGGRPAVIRQCGRCGVELGARAMRLHTPRCGARD